MRPNLIREGGVTKISLDNGERLRRAFGLPIAVRLVYTTDGPDWYRVFACYMPPNSDPRVHVFTGFSWGYGGEGPRGLAEWCKANDVPLDMPAIACLPNTGNPGEVWIWTSNNNAVARAAIEASAGLPQGEG